MSDPTDATRRSWLAAQTLFKTVTVQPAENKRFLLQQRHFEEGESMGHMLAMLVRTQQPAAFISVLRDSRGIQW